MMMVIWKFLWPIRAWWHKGLEKGSYFPDFPLNDECGREYALSDNPDGRLTVLWLAKSLRGLPVKSAAARRVAPGGGGAISHPGR